VAKQAIALADAGTCTLATVLPVVLGANLGLGLVDRNLVRAFFRRQRTRSAMLYRNRRVTSPAFRGWVSLPSLNRTPVLG